MPFTVPAKIPAMPDPGFIHSLPELMLLVRRDGSLLEAEGGRGVPALLPLGNWEADEFRPLWPQRISELIAQLARRAIGDRGTIDGQFELEGRAFDIRAMAMGRDRCACVIRASASTTAADRRNPQVEATPELDRRGFLRRLKEALSDARLREKPIAVAVIQIEDVTELDRVIEPRVSEQIVRRAMQNLLAAEASRPTGEPAWELGQLKDNLLALWIDSADRDRIESCVSRLCAALREPANIGDTAFQLGLHAGVALLGLDANSPQTLVDHARVAAAEARRSASGRVFFFSDTLKMKSLARLDVAREMHAAIEAGHFRLRYRYRHDLRSGARTALVGYIGWKHPLRGSIPPSEFLPVAQSMGLAAALSRSVLRNLRADFALLNDESPDVRLSFGALRAHALEADFPEDLQRAVADAALPAARLEIRLAESAVVSRDPTAFGRLRDMGVRIVADEMGRDLIPLPRLAGAPLWGLQLDRAWVNRLPHDEGARRLCCALVGMAKALEFIPLASGVDTPAHRDALLTIGCEQGTGDLYGGP
jgi:predicted signal transduction protein with EAL and GGDEF domain